MKLKAQWILTEKQILSFQNQKKKIYLQYQLQFPNQLHVTKSTIRKFIYFMRSRKRQTDYPFKFQKIIYYAVALYKRYYLVNTYIQEEPIQSLICAVYSSLKLNQYEEVFLKKMASKWKQKSVFAPTKRIPHFDDEGYTVNQINFLAGIGFQTALSKLIQPIQAIFDQISKRSFLREHKIQKSDITKDKAYDFYHLLPCIFQTLQRLYCHSTLIFLYEGSKLALAVMVMVLKIKEKPLSIMGEELQTIAQINMDQLQTIISLLEIEQDQNSQYDTQVMKLSKILKYKKPQPRKSSQSPKFQPRHDSFLQ